MSEVSDFEDVVALAVKLSPLERVRLVERLMTTLEDDLRQAEMSSEIKPRYSLYGLLADLGPAPSAEDIDEARREMWRNFPREDI